MVSSLLCEPPSKKRGHCWTASISSVSSEPDAKYLEIDSDSCAADSGMSNASRWKSSMQQFAEAMERVKAGLGSYSGCSP